MSQPAAAAEPLAVGQQVLTGGSGVFATQAGRELFDFFRKLRGVAGMIRGGETGISPICSVRWEIMS